MFTPDAAFNFEVKRFLLIWVQLVPDVAIVWYACLGSKMPKHTWHTMENINAQEQDEPILERF